MERIQRLVARMVKGMRILAYKERHRRLNLFSLERRRLRGELILAYNIFHGRLDFLRAEFSRPQRNGIYEGMTSRYVIVISVYSRGKQPTP